MKWYGKTLKLKRGITINLVLTFRCNLRCSYCNNDFASGGRPIVEESDFNDWKSFIDRWPYDQIKIKEFAIIGGESILYEYFVDIVNYLLDKGFHVKVYTNLTNIEKYKQITKSYRFRLSATYHKEGNYLERFQDNYYAIKKYHNIVAYEIGERSLPFTKLKTLQVCSEDQCQWLLCVDPKRRIWLGGRDVSLNHEND
jgi:organic radical activating enzyme